MNSLDTFSGAIFRYGEFDAGQCVTTPPVQRFSAFNGEDSLCQNAYVIGKMRVQFSSEGVQREFNRMARLPGDKALEANSAKQLLSEEGCFSLARDLEWILTVDNEDAYSVQPRSDTELKQMIESLVMSAGEISYHVVTGVVGDDVTLATGNRLPALRCDYLMAFTFKEFIGRIGEVSQVDENHAAEMFTKLLVLSNNLGVEAGDIALNYSMLNCMEVYQLAGDIKSDSGDVADSAGKSYSFTEAVAEPSKLQGERRLINVIYKYEMRGSEQKLLRACRVDVTDEYPCMVQSLQPYCPSP